MRPGELNYNSRAKHYFDTSNGEVLVGAQERRTYISSGADPDNVVELGPLLRAPEEEAREWEHERLPTHDWDKDRYVAYGRWIKRVVAPPTEDRHQTITRDVIDNAARLGLGPNAYAIRGEYDNLSNFYVEIRAENAYIKGYWSQWTLHDFADHLRRVGRDRRPTKAEVDEYHQRNPKFPNSVVIRDRFKDLGHFEGALTLAGYPVIERWTYDDYLDWGVKFMEANHGMIPTQAAIDYLSKKRLGPSGRTIAVNCNGLLAYQADLKVTFATHSRERRQISQQKLKDLKSDLESGDTPWRLFGSEDEGEAESPIRFSDIEKMFTEQELLQRFAKYKVVTSVLPRMSEKKRIEVAAGRTTHRGFVPSITKHHDISAGEVEYAALTLGFFDDIWPMDGHIERMRLGQDFDEFRRLRGLRKYARRLLREEARL